MVSEKLNQETRGGEKQKIMLRENIAENSTASLSEKERCQKM